MMTMLVTEKLFGNCVSCRLGIYHNMAMISTTVSKFTTFFFDFCFKTFHDSIKFVC